VRKYPLALSDWNARQYLKFEEERTRPPRDLLAQVPLHRTRVAVDLGCGPGNSTELLVERYPDAKVIGLDSSKDMLRQARERLPQCEFIEADLATWTPREPVDLLFANAVLQWVPDHQAVMKRLIEALPQGGVLATQTPDNTREPSHVLMQEVANREPWANQLALVEAARLDLPSPESYYDLLKPLCQRVEIWHTIYNHVLAGPDAIVEWFKGSALRPFLSALDARAADDFLQAYTAEIARHYAPRFDGQVLLRFPRLFLVATK
jgi:trans-aconitate 2-methyltransferase